MATLQEATTINHLQSLFTEQGNPELALHIILAAHDSHKEINLWKLLVRTAVPIISTKLIPCTPPQPVLRENLPRPTETIQPVSWGQTINSLRSWRPETPSIGQVEEQELNVPDDINEEEAPPEEEQEGAKQ
ncbi:hypothetical protein CHUAL_009574 [Chamberlinius hualienensis]